MHYVNLLVREGPFILELPRSALSDAVLWCDALDVLLADSELRLNSFVILSINQMRYRTGSL